MAKGARASSRKENKIQLRCKVFAPQETARTERLSARLLELASKPKDVTTMEVETETHDSTASQKHVERLGQSEEMETDQDNCKPTFQPNTNNTTRVRKRSNHRKTAIIFRKYNEGGRRHRLKSK